MTDPPDPSPGYSGPPPSYSGPPPGYWQPQQGLSPADERTWAMFAHIGAIIAGFVAMAFLGPLIILLTQGTKSAFVRRHAVESLNFQITLLLALVAAAIVSIATLGLALLIVIPIGIVVGIVALVLIVVAGVRAHNGEDYRYPLNIRLVS